MSSPYAISEGDALGQRIKWLIVFRLATATVLALGTLIVRPGDTGPTLFGPSFAAVLTITLGHLVMAMVFGLYYRYVRVTHVSGFIFTQIIWDLLFTTALVYITGGVESEFKFMYWLTIINAAVLLFQKGAFSAAAVSAILYGTLVDLQFYGLIPPALSFFVEEMDWPEKKVISSIVLNTGVFFAVAYISSYLTVRLRQTEKMLVEKSLDLEDLEDLMGRIVESLTSGLATLDAKGLIRYWSRAAEEITGLALKEVQGQKFVTIFPGTEGVPLSAEGSDLEPKPWRWETEYGKELEPKKMLGFSVSPLKHGDEGKRGTLVIFQDLTRYREMEGQIKRADQLAAVGEVAARMAHEIRNPLTSVSGAIEVLQSQLKLEEQDQRLMEIVVRETDRLNGLLTEFLLFARPSPPKFEEVSVDELLRETADLFSKSQGMGQPNMALDIETGVSLFGDPKRLSQMFWNLLKNASDATSGEGEIRVVLRCDTKNGQAEIVVQDQGLGIPKGIRDRIFQPFVTSKTRGTGLGLAMVRRIVDEHHGEIAVESGEGVGTHFKIRLPQKMRISGMDGRA